MAAARAPLPGDSKLDPFATMDPQAVLKACVARGWKGLRVGDHDTAVELGDVVAVVLSGKTGEAHAKRLQAVHGAWPKTPRFVDPSSDERRVAYFFRLPQGVTHLPSAVNVHGAVEGVSVLTAGRELVPPSVKDNVDLRWERTVHPLFTDVQPLPGYLVEMVRNPVEARRAWTATQTPSGATPRTDYGNAERLVRRHGNDLRFCASLGGWLAWDGVRWGKDETGEVVRRAKETVRSIAVEAATSDHEESRRGLLAHSLASEKASRLTAMVTLAQSEAGVPVRAEDLDADPWLLNVRNGLLNLRTGQLEPARRDALCTKLSPVVYDPAATCPLFDAFLERVQPDPQVRACLLRVLGYSLTGVIREHILPIHHGTGRNGKGTLRDAVLYVMGDYGTEVPVSLLMAKDRDAHPTEKMVLRGARFASASETEKGRAINEPLVKLFTGGDPITARLMHRDFVTFFPTHKLWLSTNHRPIIRELSPAMWCRILLFPWTVFIPPEEQDGDLSNKLRAEAPGILCRLVQACLEWQARGVDPPDAVKAATEGYRAESDPLADFLAQRTTTEPLPGKTVARALAKELLDAYTQWARANGADPLTAKALGDALGERFKRVPYGGLSSYVGVRLLGPEEKPKGEAGAKDGVDGAGGEDAPI